MTPGATVGDITREENEKRVLFEIGDHGFLDHPRSRAAAGTRECRQ
jgi:hypothetical protein